MLDKDTQSLRKNSPRHSDVARRLLLHRLNTTILFVDGAATHTSRYSSNAYGRCRIVDLMDFYVTLRLLESTALGS